jgi:adenine-specific DNA-methyltransferase
VPTLNWIGKDKVVNHHLDVPYRTLEEQYRYGDPEAAGENKIIHGDNLEALKSLLPEYEGQVKCIYIDPPYNTGNEGWVYNDNVNHPKIKKWLGDVVGKEGEDLTRHDKWLCMMYPRLKLLHRLLSQDGVIFVSLDDTELVSLLGMLDEIFGRGKGYYKSWWIEGMKEMGHTLRTTTKSSEGVMYAPQPRYPRRLDCDKHRGGRSVVD